MDNGIFLDLTQFADYETAAAAVNPNALAIFTWKDAQYVLPVGLAIRSLGFRTDLFDAAGVEYPDPTTPLTIDQLVELSKKLTIVDQDGKVTQYTWNPTNAEFYYSLVDYRGGQMFDSWVNPTQVTINTPEGIAGLADLKLLIDEKVIPPMAELTGNQWGDGGLSSLLTTKVAMADLGPWNFADIVKDELPISNTVYPINGTSDVSIIHSGANGYGINAMTAHPEEAWAFLKWMSSKPAQLEYAKWSDFPANTEAFEEVSQSLEPAELVPALVEQIKGFRPSLVTVDPELGNVMFEVMRDMTEGRLTPEEAAAEMEQRGNEILGYEG
jgi:multiple sugar transport system substrate-binding protein